MDDYYRAGEDRYSIKRQAGIGVTRRDGSKYSKETDRQAAAAEKYVADYMGCEFNSEITVCGDKGYDFIYRGLEVEVYHPDNPHAQYLIVDPVDKKRWADLYVVVTGTIESGFVIKGWATHHKLMLEPMRDFGYGNRYAVRFDKLKHIDLLLDSVLVV